ncbi:hypothetical protein Ciccas_014497 [Cichlidogyrus casuarinus]|uniref:Uncharacterized protein n=1 Tax=Cichlidogyrus casuarinus TaxID=1844966 RepID=A0ABD2PI88_9PLAT
MQSREMKAFLQVVQADQNKMKIENKENLFTLCRNGGDEKELEALLESDSSLDINKADTNGYAPIHYVAKYNRSNLLAVLVRRKCDINLVTKDGKRMTALHLLAKYQSKDRVREMSIPYSEQTLTSEELMKAEKERIDQMLAQEQDFQCEIACMRLLVQDSQLEVNATDYLERTPLHIAAIVNNYSFARDLCFSKRRLIKEKVSPNNATNPVSLRVSTIIARTHFSTWA